MNKKQITGFVVGLCGIALSLYSLYNMKRIASAKGAVNQVSGPFSGNVAGDMVHGGMMSQVSQYDLIVTIMLIAGIVMIIIGGVILLRGYKKRH